MPSKIHFTRDWVRTVCSPRLGCGERPVVSDPKLLAYHRHYAICGNCERMMTLHERQAHQAERAKWLTRRTD